MARAARGGNVRREAGVDGGSLWDRPSLLNLMADLLFVAGGFLMVWALLLAVQSLPLFPLRQVAVAASPEQVGRAQIEHVARTSLAGNFFTVNLNDVRDAFEHLPWVRRADVRRVWPDAVAVTLEEHRAVARWTPLDGESRLVNHHGEVFIAQSGEALPAFVGPEGSADRVLARYGDFADGLKPLGRHPVAVTLSPREAWQLRLDDGVVLELGRDQPKHPLGERIERFVATYERARARFPTALGSVDMRYPNGFALKPRGAGQT